MSLLARPGSDDDWGEVVDLHEPTLRRVIMRRTADRTLVEDALQETYVRAWRARVSGSQRGLPDARWMRTLASRASIDVFRRQPRMDHLDPAALVGEWLTADRAAPPGSDEHVDALVSRQAVRWAFRRLTPRQRRLLVLRGVRNLTYREIAEREGIGEGAVASALNRARERLRIHLAEYAEGARSKPALVALAYEAFVRARARMARVQSVLGAHVGEVVGTTAALGLAVAMTAAVPEAPIELSAASSLSDSGAGVAVNILRDVAVAEDGAGDTGRGTAAPPRPTATASEAAPPDVSSRAPLADVDRQVAVTPEEVVVRYRIDLAPYTPGAQRNEATVTVYCMRSKVLRPACPTMTALPGNQGNGSQ
ncbi:MAG: sigma-70 family RNA polymerase sigma factor [Actinobacteria bacterium]|nr:sigma-70 family RNA polymerase sigma factor [Actinomycetota bacterium]